ncbi:hypothetical protein BDK51DRAFT_39127 [Blyttiomyces helicus]|uniref:Uncharacterized protein n=1 Tax=Blyttiomyces helicus TaxID=388810 RepID=A0A4P9VW60_9FUNG|nr:hypothetical protein BDK51DRAFT_39127 [Blyttiomyces helicus]|eukprot:RKO83924.1 hypothetical protein BDK51DRAFT_39127 [Blyttiomyces helicus]
MQATKVEDLGRVFFKLAARGLDISVVDGIVQGDSPDDPTKTFDSALHDGYRQPHDEEDLRHRSPPPPACDARVRTRGAAVHPVIGGKEHPRRGWVPRGPAPGIRIARRKRGARTSSSSARGGVKVVGLTDGSGLGDEEGRTAGWNPAHPYYVCIKQMKKALHCSVFVGRAGGSAPGSGERASERLAYSTCMHQSSGPSGRVQSAHLMKVPTNSELPSLNDLDETETRPFQPIHSVRKAQDLRIFLTPVAPWAWPEMGRRSTTSDNGRLQDLLGNIDALLRGKPPELDTSSSLESILHDPALASLAPAADSSGDLAKDRRPACHGQERYSRDAATAVSSQDKADKPSGFVRSSTPQPENESLCRARSPFEPQKHVEDGDPVPVHPADDTVPLDSRNLTTFMDESFSMPTLDEAHFEKLAKRGL